MWFIPIIMAAVGAQTGIISAWQKGKQEKAALQHGKDNAWRQYLTNQAYENRQFAIQREAAFGELDARERGLNAQVGLSVDDFNTSLLAQAYGIQDARIQNESGIGMSLASEGASGTRGGSSGEALRAYASQSLERNIGVQEQQNKNQLNSMVTGANQAADAIGRERASWKPGGFRALEKETRDAYNRDVALLGQSDFDWKIGQAKPTWLDYATLALGGGAQGFSTGASIAEYGEKWGSKFKSGKTGGTDEY